MSIIRQGSNRVLSVGLQVGSNSRDVAGSTLVGNEDQPPVSPESSTPLGVKGIDGWQIMAAVCISRHPVLCPPMSPIEHTYSQHLSKLEVENSLQSDFELQILEDNARKVLGDEVNLLDEGPKQMSALEQLDMWKKEQEDFEKIRSYSSDAPPGGVGDSLSRQVVLVQRYKLGSQNSWLLPQGPWQPGETLRQTSERIVAESCDPALGVRIMGNSPVGFFKYKYPKEVRAKGYIGAKVFFYRGQVGNRLRRSLPVLQSKGRPEQKWLTRQQILDQLQQSYVKAITQFIIDDS